MKIACFGRRVHDIGQLQLSWGIYPPVRSGIAPVGITPLSAIMPLNFRIFPTTTSSTQLLFVLAIRAAGDNDTTEFSSPQIEGSLLALRRPSKEINGIRLMIEFNQIYIRTQLRLVVLFSRATSCIIHAHFLLFALPFTGLCLWSWSWLWECECSSSSGSGLDLGLTSGPINSSKRSC